MDTQTIASLEISVSSTPFFSMLQRTMLYKQPTQLQMESWTGSCAEKSSISAI